MILFTILVTILALIGLGALILLCVGGAALILPIVDVIVCVAIVVFIVRFLIKRFKK